MTGKSLRSALWLEEQLERALARIETFGREVARLQADLGAREQELDELRQGLATVEGRTRRHEATQDVLPELRQSVAAIEERLALESSLRRDQFAATERGQDRELATGRSVERALLDVADRLDAVERMQAATTEREARLGGDLAGRDLAIEQIGARTEALQAQIESITAAGRRDAGALEQLREALDAARQHAVALEARTEVLQRDQQRFEDDLVALRRLADREAMLADLAEQQRVLRLRIEEGLAALEQRVSSEHVAGTAEAEAHALLRAHLVAVDREVAGVVAQVEAQRQVLLEHFRRMTASAEDVGRRQTEEIDRRVRAARELLVRLAESADEATREQPL